MDTANFVNPSASHTSHLFADDGTIPNNPMLPLLVYKSAIILAQGDVAAICEAVFIANRWGSSWRNGIYSFHHYHSTAHEVLAIARGSATVHLGGEAGIRMVVKAGDVIVIPAGVGHKNLGSSADLLVVGAYPPGRRWDLCDGSPGERPQALKNIAAVPLPSTDPVFGVNGPLIEQWIGE